MSLTYGQIVELDNERGKVIKIWLDFLNRRMAEIEFFDPYLANYVDYEISIERKDTLAQTKSKERKNRFRSTDECCPRCGTKWTKTSGEYSIWYDCLPCGKKKEDLI